jgi:hypothetical protein
MKISFALKLRNACRLMWSLRMPTARGENCSEEEASFVFEVRWKPAALHAGFTAFGLRRQS